MGTFFHDVLYEQQMQNFNVHEFKAMGMNIQRYIPDLDCPISLLQGQWMHYAAAKMLTAHCR